MPPWPDRLELVADRALTFHQFVIRLQPDKKSLRHVEIAREPKVGIGGDRALAEYDFIDPSRRHADGARERGLRQLHRLQKLLQQDFALMRIGQQFNGCRQPRLGAYGLVSRRNRFATAR
jgi:hypothetical protein